MERKCSYCLYKTAMPEGAAIVGDWLCSKTGRAHILDIPRVMCPYFAPRNGDNAPDTVPRYQVTNFYTGEVSPVLINPKAVEKYKNKNIEENTKKDGEE